MKKVRIAQIGTSRYSHGNIIIKSLAKQTDLYEVVGYVLPENEREKFPEAMVGNFARIIRGEGENPATPDYELALYKTVLKAIGR